MKITSFLYRSRWIHVPTATLVALLQRTPAIHVLEMADGMIAEPPAGAVVKSAVAAAAALGAINSLAGATTLASSPLSSPVSATVGTAISTTAITVDGTTSQPGSWNISGSVPGLSFTNSNSGTPNGSGNIDVPNGVLFLSGTPTTAGTYNVSMIAYEFAGEGGIQSPTYTFTVVVSASGGPTFTTEPQSTTVNVGQSVTLTAAATGSATYQWEKGGSPIGSATGATYTIASPQTADSGNYSVIATSGGASTTSATATLTVVSTSSAPVFTSQPLSQPNVTQGVTVNFNATAVGGTVGYQWQFASGTLVTNGVDADGNSYSGVGTSTLTVVANGSGSQYKVIATNTNGSTTSSTATMTVASVGTTPVFTTEPETQSATIGQTVTFNAVASGAASYQWNFNNVAIGGATNTSLMLTNVQTSASGSYTCVATGPGSQDIYGDPIPGNTTTSSIGTLTVTSVAVPVFTTQPVAQTVNVGQTATFTAAATGSPTYQWTFNGANITGNASATTATLSLTNVQLSAIGSYACVATNGGGSVPSSSVSLNVINVAPPTFTQAASPSSVTIDTGRSVAFNAIATGTPAPSYQWTLNGSTSIPGASNTTDPILLIAGATNSNSGNYTCTATNTDGTATTTAALTVQTTGSAARLSNLSARAEDLAGGNTLIAGLTLGGSGTEPILLRGVGPTLGQSPSNISNFLPNPVITFYDHRSVPIVSDQGWGNAFTAGASTLNVSPTAATTSLMNQVGASTIAVGSLDSAMEVQLGIGGYTVQLTDANSAAGVGLAEVYDAGDASSPTRLTNISARADVGAGGDILIGGLVVTGASGETVLLRAVGPGLVNQGLPANSGLLPQPVLEVYDGGTEIYSNIGWGGDPVIQAAATLVGATNLLTPDCAVLLTLPPGAYTVLVGGVSGASGVGLVEVFEIY